MERPVTESDGGYTAPRVAWQLCDFDIVRRLGDGSFSHVIEVIHKATGRHYALKVVDKHLILRHKQVDKIKQERRLLDRLSNPGIVKLHFTFQDEASLYFGLELCPNGELYDQIRLKKTLLAGDARQYAAEILLILEYLHSQQVVHCDLKPENLLLDGEGHLKLADFGSALDLAESARLVGESQKRRPSLAGTADYVSPEALNGKPLDAMADLWAFGCIIYQMLVGRPPFRAASEYLTFQKVAAAEFELPANLPETSRDLVSRLLVLEPQQRLGAGGFQELRQHPFFKGVEWENIRLQPAPELALEEAGVGDSSGHEDVDWELSSLAASLPLKYEYDAPQRVPAE